jgi:phosphoglycolate phosphatase-like HAD superfamily hydrolase
MEPILGVLFDLDGTLLDVEDAHTIALNNVLPRFSVIFIILRPLIFSLSPNRFFARFSLSIMRTVLIILILAFSDTYSLIPELSF